MKNVYLIYRDDAYSEDRYLDYFSTNKTGLKNRTKTEILKFFDACPVDDVSLSVIKSVLDDNTIQTLHRLYHPGKLTDKEREDLSSIIQNIENQSATEWIINVTGPDNVFEILNQCGYDLYTKESDIDQNLLKKVSKQYVHHLVNDWWTI